MENKYNLTTENRIKSIFNTKIEDYWKRYGKQGTFKGTDNTRINYMTFIREGIKDNRIAIVISSGRTECMIKYMEFIYDLGKLGYSVYIHDHRGQGYSERLTENPHKGHVRVFDDYVRDLKIFYDKVISLEKHDKVFLIGHSMGGTIASLYAEKYKKDFDALILTSPMFAIYIDTIPYGFACAMVKGFDRIWSFFAGRFGLDPIYITGAGDYEKAAFKDNKLTQSRVRYQIFRNLYDKNPAVKVGGPTIHWISRAFIDSKEAIDNASEIEIDVLLLSAGKDKVVGLEEQKRFCENLLKGKTRQTSEMIKQNCPYVIKDAVHEILMEKDIYRIEALTKILDFIAVHSE